MYLILDPHLKVVLSLNKMTIPPILQVLVSHTIQCTRTCTFMCTMYCLLHVVFSMSSPILVSIQYDNCYSWCRLHAYTLIPQSWLTRFSLGAVECICTLDVIMQGHVLVRTHGRLQMSI